MSRFTVVWDPDVERTFIKCWVAANSETRARLTEIANWVDANLAEKPADTGQPRADLGAYIIAVPLINSPARVTVTYEVWREDKLVHVIRLTIRGL